MAMTRYKKTGKKSFALSEAMIGALILSIIGSGMAGLYILQAGLLSKTMHRLEAINYARSAAEALLEAGRDYATDSASANLLSAGTHSDAVVCDIPQSYFRDYLGGKMTYTVTDITIDPTIKARRADITVTWKDKLPKAQDMKETLAVIAYFYSTA